jgi:hypothetical protein
VTSGRKRNEEFGSSDGARRSTGSRGLALSGAAAAAQAHEPVSYTDKCPLTKNSWESPNGSRMAEIALAPAKKSRHP